MTNFEAIQRMSPDELEHFLNCVYDTGLNNGVYSETNGDDIDNGDVLGSPYDKLWLLADAEPATVKPLTGNGDSNIPNACAKAILRNAGVKYE